MIAVEGQYADAGISSVRPTAQSAGHGWFQRHDDAVSDGWPRLYFLAGTSPDQQTVASALQVCSSKTMKSKKSSQVTVFFPTV